MDDIKAIRDALAGVPKVQQWRAYVHPLQPDELQGYADIVGSNRDDDVAENVPLPLARYIAAAHPERIARLLDALELAQAALYRIAMLNPATDSDEGWNEWGEADCFKQAQKIARASLPQSPAADQSAP